MPLVCTLQENPLMELVLEVYVFDFWAARSVSMAVLTELSTEDVVEAREPSPVALSMATTPSQEMVLDPSQADQCSTSFQNFPLVPDRFRGNLMAHG